MLHWQGDKFFVCWDSDLVPATVVQVALPLFLFLAALRSLINQSYDYPPNKEHVSRQVTRADLAHHFASYNK